MRAPSVGCRHVARMSGSLRPSMRAVNALLERLLCGGCSGILPVMRLPRALLHWRLMDRPRVQRHCLFWLAIGTLFIAATDAWAADAACASLLADEIVFADTQSEAGSRAPKRSGRPVAQSSAHDNVVALAMVQAITAATTQSAESVALSGEALARYRGISLNPGSDAGVAELGDVARAVAKSTGVPTVYLAVKLAFRHWRAANEILVGVGAYGNVGQTLAVDTWVAPFVGAALLRFDAAGQLKARHDVTVHRDYPASVTKLENARSPWDILTEAELGKAVDELLFEAVYDGMRGLVK
jgi:hypothetical protein